MTEQRYLSIYLLAWKLTIHKFVLHKPAAGTPYENGVFRMKLLLSHDFPQSPPKGVVLLLFANASKSCCYL